MVAHFIMAMIVQDDQPTLFNPVPPSRWSCGSWLLFLWISLLLGHCGWCKLSMVNRIHFKIDIFLVDGVAADESFESGNIRHSVIPFRLFFFFRLAIPTSPASSSSSWSARHLVGRLQVVNCLGQECYWHIVCIHSSLLSAVFFLDSLRNVSNFQASQRLGWWCMLRSFWAGAGDFVWAGPGVEDETDPSTAERIACSSLTTTDVAEKSDQSELYTDESYGASPFDVTEVANVGEIWWKLMLNLKILCWFQFSLLIFYIFPPWDDSQIWKSSLKNVSPTARYNR